MVVMMEGGARKEVMEEAERDPYMSHSEEGPWQNRGHKETRVPEDWGGGTEDQGGVRRKELNGAKGVEGQGPVKDPEVRGVGRVTREPGGAVRTTAKVEPTGLQAEVE